MTRDPRCPRCHKLTSVERLRDRIGKGGCDSYCSTCSLVFRSDPTDDDDPKEAA